jgi:hypothetical protein
VTDQTGRGLSRRRLSRRGLLERGAVALTGATTLAGCTDTTSSGEPDETARTVGTETVTATTTTTESETVSTASPETASPTPRATTVDGLDLREANVMGVTVEDATPVDGRDATDYRLAVTLYHDDEGESGYANWWQVETRSGRRLGRRELVHAHGTREFTRSATVTVPDVAETVVVRGHDQTHGYGGQAALVTLADATVEFRNQGPEPDEFGVGTSRGTAAREWP